MTHDLSVTNIVSLFEMTKTERASFITRIVEALDGGTVDPLKVHLQVKNMEKVITGLTSTNEKENPDNIDSAKKYRRHVLEAALQQGKEFDYYNSRMKIAEVGVKYDYSQCNDPELLNLESEVAKLTEQLKSRQKFLQTVSEKGMDVLIGDELVKVYPPSKSSTTNVNVTLK